MSDKAYKVSVLAKKDEFEDYQDVILALFPDTSVKVTHEELVAKIHAHLGRVVK